MSELYGLVGTPRIFAGNLAIIVMQDQTPRGMDQLYFEMVKVCGHDMETQSKTGGASSNDPNNTTVYSERMDGDG